MATPYNAGLDLAQNNKPLPPQGSMSATTYQQLAAGWHAGK